MRSGMDREALGDWKVVVRIKALKSSEASENWRARGESCGQKGYIQSPELSTGKQAAE